MNDDKMTDEEKIKKGICPDCGNRLAFKEKCKMCEACGWSACGVN